MTLFLNKTKSGRGSLKGLDVFYELCDVFIENLEVCHLLFLSMCVIGQKRLWFFVCLLCEWIFHYYFWCGRRFSASVGFARSW